MADTARRRKPSIQGGDMLRRYLASLPKEPVPPAARKQRAQKTGAVVLHTGEFSGPGHFAAWRARLAQDPGAAQDAPVALVNLWMAVRDRLPRGVRWNDFPWLLHAPAFENSMHAEEREWTLPLHHLDAEAESWARRGDWIDSNVPLISLLRGCADWMVDRDEGSPWRMGRTTLYSDAYAGLFLASVGPFSRAARVRAIASDGTVEELGKPADAARILLEKALPTLRFEQQYKLNARSLIRPILLGLAEKLGLDRSEEHGMRAAVACWKRGEVRGMESPLALQLLYSWAKADGEAPIGRVRYWNRTAGMRHRPERAALLAAHPWPGTGKHGPIGFSNLEISSLLDNSLGGVVVEAAGTGTETRPRLTPLGEALLDALPPDCEDPDLVLRWRDPATGMIPASAGAAMDDWTKRWFGKIKNKLDRGQAPRA